MLPVRRISRALRWAALAVLLVGPIAIAAVEVHGSVARLRLGGAGSEIGPGDPRVRDYLHARSPLVDRLLPDGRGGTRFFEDLDGNAGMAFLGASAIGVSMSVDQGAWPESVELHERAHLVDAFLPMEVAALLARLPAPDAREIAALDRGQHFAEMAAKAWEVVTEPTGVCVDGTREDRLEDLEGRVPGTAGFVARYLRLLPPTESALSDAHAALLAMADRLSAPQHDQWAAIWHGVDARRNADGTFAPWEHQSIRQYLLARRLALSVSDRWIDRVAAVGLLPSLAIITIAEMI